MENSNGISKKTTVGPLKLERVYKNQYQKEGTQTAEFKQTVTTVSSYPSKSVASSLEDNLFTAEDCGFESQDYTNKSTRVAWLNVPESLTEEQVRAKLESNPNAMIQRHYSNHPILSSQQEYGIKSGLTTKDAIAESQLLRYPKGSENEGEVILDRETGKPIYKIDVFRTSKVEDVDTRNADKDDYYMPESLKAEVEGKGLFA